MTKSVNDFAEYLFFSLIMQAEILAKNFEDAQKYCDECLKIAEKLGQPNLIKTAKQCGQDVKEVQAKENEQKKSQCIGFISQNCNKVFFLSIFIYKNIHLQGVIIPCS